MSDIATYRVLLVDDDPHVLEALDLLLDDIYSTVHATSGQMAIDLVTTEKDIGVVVMDIKMPEMNGIDAARKIRELAPDIPVIFHTGFPGQFREDQIDAEETPFDFVQKGGPVSRVVRAVRNAMDNYLSRRQVAHMTEFAREAFGMVGKSAPMKEVYRILRKVAPTDSKVMILGDTGTGKELVARAIHNNSKRRLNRLAVFNCNHRTPDLVDSELFGHGKGAFTGAINDRVGLFEYADGGSVFLDEIGDLDITTQAKILRVIETGEFNTMGKSPELKTTDVRILCATHHDLAELVRKGEFREDLYYRLKGVVITLPPLRERREDIPLLIDRFMCKFTIERDMLPKHFDQSALCVLLNYDWPGNVRELQDTIESLVVLTESHIIIARDVEKYLELSEQDKLYKTNGDSLPARLHEFRRNCIIEALSVSDNSVRAAARLLKVDPSNLYKWIRNHKIDLG